MTGNGWLAILKTCLEGYKIILGLILTMKHQYQISWSPILSVLFWSPSLSFTHNCTPNCPLWGKQQHQYKILDTLEYHHSKKQTVILTCTVYSLRWFWRSRGTCCGLRSLSPPHCSLSPLSGSALWPQPEVPLCQNMLDLHNTCLFA